MNIRKIEKQEPRVETGLIKFGDDWTGTFIRGDDSFHFAMHLRRFLNGENDKITRGIILNLLSLLESSDERKVNSV